MTLNCALDNSIQVRSTVRYNILFALFNHSQFQDWVSVINSKMNSKKRDHPAIKEEYQQLYQQLFESGGRGGEPSSSSQTVEPGPYWKKFGRVSKPVGY